jgi:hypothetical protein
MIVRGERGLPIRERSFGNWFRDIARAANIPDEVATTVRYIGRRGSKRASVADKRSARRAAENDGGTG